jgi:hypothetical protein
MALVSLIHVLYAHLLTNFPADIDFGLLYSLSFRPILRQYYQNILEQSNAMLLPPVRSEFLSLILIINGPQIRQISLHSSRS